MSKYLAAVCCAAVMVVIAAAAHASMIIADNIVGLTERADVVIRVDCKASEKTFAGKQVPGVAKVAGVQPRVKAMKRYTFTIKDVLVNKTAQAWRAGDVFDFGQFQGFTMSSGQIVRPSVRLPDFQTGSEYVIFLKKRGDRYFTVGVNQGVFDVADGNVSNMSASPSFAANAVNSSTIWTSSWSAEPNADSAKTPIPILHRSQIRA